MVYTYNFTHGLTFHFGSHLTFNSDINAIRNLTLESFYVDKIRLFKGIWFCHWTLSFYCSENCRYIFSLGTTILKIYKNKFQDENLFDIFQFWNLCLHFFLIQNKYLFDPIGAHAKINCVYIQNQISVYM